jgi:hypothetical protein
MIAHGGSFVYALIYSQFYMPVLALFGFLIIGTLAGKAAETLIIWFPVDPALLQKALESSRSVTPGMEIREPLSGTDSQCPFFEEASNF